MINKEPELIRVSEVRKYLGQACNESVKTKEQVFFIINAALKLKLDFSSGNDITDACGLAIGGQVKDGKSVKLRFNHKKYLKEFEVNKHGSLQSTGNKKKRKQSRSKKSVSKASTQVSS